MANTKKRKARMRTRILDRKRFRAAERQALLTGRAQHYRGPDAWSGASGWRNDKLPLDEL